LHAVKSGWVWLVWVAALVLAITLYDGIGGSRQAPGVAQVHLIPVGSPQPARVSDVLVRAGQRVEAGDVLATLDTTVLDAEIAAAQHEVHRLEAEVHRESVLLSAQQLDQARRLNSDARESAQQLMQARTIRAQADAELASLRAEIERQALLVEQQLAPAGQLEALRRQEAVLRARRRGQTQLAHLLERSSTDSLRRLQAWAELDSAAAPQGAQSGARRVVERAAETDKDVRVRSGVEPSDASPPAERATSRVELLLSPVLRAAQVAQRRLEALQAQRASFFELRAPTRGYVASVLLPPGSVVGPAAPVLTLVPLSSRRRVIAYLTEDQALQVHEGQAARLTPKGRRGPPLNARVEALAPAISEMPVRFRRVFKHPAWCREVFLNVVDAPADLLPGQAFDVRFLQAAVPLRDKPDTSPGDQDLAPEAAASPHLLPQAGLRATGPALGVAPLQVPTELATRSRVEASGLVWIPEWRRYLVVSDDTGTKEENDHAPWVLTLGPDGRFDPTPVVVQGLDEVNDLESVARCSDGLYLLSSQSSSRRGRRPLSRQLLVRAQPGPDRTLRADGAVPLLASLARAAAGKGGRAWLRGLGLTADPGQLAASPTAPGAPQALEIEGMACVDGALVLGLKEPLGHQREAILWRLEAPGKLLREGAVDRTALSLLGRLHLTEPHTGKSLPMGIAGLSETPGGGLLLTSTLPAPVEGVMVGALWSVPNLAPDASGLLGAELLRTFPNLKPEGVTVTPDGSTLLVFDRGKEEPLWWRGKP